MRRWTASRSPDCERCDAPRPSDAVVWIRRGLFVLGFVATALWAMRVLEVSPSWSTVGLTRHDSTGPMLLFLAPAIVSFTAAALLRRRSDWTCRACGHRNGEWSTRYDPQRSPSATRAPVSLDSDSPRRSVVSPPRRSGPLGVRLALSLAIPVAWVVTGFILGWPPMARAGWIPAIFASVGVALVVWLRPGLR